MSGLDEKALLPCPMCGGISVEIRATPIGDYFCICASNFEGEMCCGLSTDPSRCETRSGAVRRWNRRANLSAATPKAGTVEVKALEWREYKALGNSIKTVAHDCFGGEFCRFDLRLSQIPQAEIDAAQASYDAAIRSALIPAPSVAEAAEPGYHYQHTPISTASGVVPAPSPTVPDGLEALVEPVAWADPLAIRALQKHTSASAVYLARQKTPAYSSPLYDRNNEAAFRRMCRENYDAFCAMRNDINELIGNMVSQESTLAYGPEQAHECAAVVKSVADAIAAIIAERDEARRERDNLGESLRNYTRLETLAQERAETAERDLSAVEAKRLAAWKDWRSLIDAILEPLPMCRDCADEDGTCPTSGLPCNTTDRAIAVHQRARSALSTALARNAEIEGETIERCAKIAERDVHLQHPTKPLGVIIRTVPASPHHAAAIRSSATKQEKAE